jgi:hypothetical protein
LKQKIRDSSNINGADNKRKRGFIFKVRIPKNSLLETIAQALVRIQNSLVQRVVISGVGFLPLDSIRLGTTYGGWWVPKYILNRPNDWIVVSCGLGYDISFDRDLSRLGFSIIGVEFSYASILYLQESESIPPGMSVIHARVGSKSEDDFNLSKISNIASNSKPGAKLMLKMDIEGSEFEFLHPSYNLETYPEVLMFELDFLSLVPFLNVKQRVQRTCSVLSMMRKLSQVGYRIYQMENWNIHFVKFHK